MKTAVARCALPVSSRVSGWLIATTTLGYPVDAFGVWRDLESRGHFTKTRVPQVTSGGFEFDVGTTIVHTGLVGWFGGLACLAALLWLGWTIVWLLRRRLPPWQLDSASQLCGLAVLVGVSASFAAHYLLWGVYGLLVS